MNFCRCRLALLLTAVAAAVAAATADQPRPRIDPGLFVIQGVSTCGNGRGYCLLSDRCGVDVDFEDDVDGGHCDGLSRHGFTPAVYFLCCRFRQPSSLDTVPPEGDGDSDEEVTTTAATTTTTTTAATTTTTTEATTTGSVKDAWLRPDAVLNIVSQAVANTNKLLDSMTTNDDDGARLSPLFFTSDESLGGQSNDKDLLKVILNGMNLRPTTEAGDAVSYVEEF